MKIKKALLTEVPFGKYKGLPLKDLLIIDIAYVYWLLKHADHGCVLAAVNRLEPLISEMYCEQQYPEESVDYKSRQE